MAERNYLPSKNYYGSSGYSAFGGSGGSGAAGSGVAQKPFQSATGFHFDAIKRMYVDNDGHAFTGPLGTSGGYSINGIFSPTAPDPASSLPKFDVIKTVKQPEVATATSGLLQQAQAQQNKTAADLATLPDLNAELTRTYTATKSANDPSKVEQQLTSSMAGQEAAQRSYTAEQGERNTDYAKETSDRIAKLTAQLDAGAAAAQATAERAAALGVTAANLTRLQNPDTATTNSGAVTSRAISAAMNALLPVQERITQARYNQTANIEQPLARELFQNDTGLIASKSALEAQFGGNWRSIYQYVQSLKQQAAQMDSASAERFIAQKLQLLGVPAQLLGGQISNLARLQQLDALANEYTFATPYQPGRLPDIPTYPIIPGTRSYTPGAIGAPSVATRNYGPGNPGNTTALAPAGTELGDRQRGVPEWAIAQRKQQGMYGPQTYAPTYGGSGLDSGGGFVTNNGVVTPLGANVNLFSSGRNYLPQNELTQSERNYINELSRSYE